MSTKKLRSLVKKLQELKKEFNDLEVVEISGYYTNLTLELWGWDVVKEGESTNFIHDDNLAEHLRAANESVKRKVIEREKDEDLDEALMSIDKAMSRNSGED